MLGGEQLKFLFRLELKTTRCGACICFLALRERTEIDLGASFLQSGRTLRARTANMLEIHVFMLDCYIPKREVSSYGHREHKEENTRQGEFA